MKRPNEAMWRALRHIVRKYPEGGKGRGKQGGEVERGVELGRGVRRGWKPEMFRKDVLSIGAWGPLLGCAESQVLLYAATAHSLAHCLMPGNHLTGMIVTVGIYSLYLSVPSHCSG